MIRRRHGTDLLLIAQHDHALLAGEVAEAFGNSAFATPLRRGPALCGIRMHDSGWPLHDEEPTLNTAGLPLDVFETPRPIAFKVWTASIERAVKADPYAGLLVSLHVLALSVLATENPRPNAGFDMNQPQDAFAVTKFQQREIERQEDLRVQLGLRSEKTPHRTVMRDTRQESEDQLQFNFALLQVMDQLSLAACCTEPPTHVSRDLPLSPGGEKTRLSFARQGDDVLVHPWPFSEGQIELKIPACRVPDKPYGSEAEFRAAFIAAPAEVITSLIRPGSG